MEIEGIPVYSYGRVSSTMVRAEEFAGEGRTVIVTAEEQSCGRGRYGREWLSLPGGLYFSMVIPEESLPVSELISLSIIKTLESFGIYCKIKFPNDIIKDGKKISGILIVKKEGSYIVGVGINVNNETGDAVERTSMKQVLEGPVEKTVVLERFVRIFLRHKKMFMDDLYVSLKNWRAYLIK